MTPDMDAAAAMLLYCAGLVVLAVGAVGIQLWVRAILTRDTAARLSAIEAAIAGLEERLTSEQKRRARDARMSPPPDQPAPPRAPQAPPENHHDTDDQRRAAVMALMQRRR